MKKRSDIGRRLQQVRYERDYTVEYVANQTGISANVIYHYENYGGVPGSEYLGKICKVLGISTDYAIYGDKIETIRRNEDIYIADLKDLINNQQRVLNRFLTKTPSKYVKEKMKQLNEFDYEYDFNRGKEE